MTSIITPAAALSGLLPGDIDVLDGASAAERLSTIKGVRSWLDVYEARVTRRIGELNKAGQCAPAADLHARNGGISSKEAQQKERRAKALEQSPSLAEKLESGEATAAHADVIANVAGRLDDETRREFFDREAELAVDATRSTPGDFEQHCRDLIRLIERDQGVERDRQQRRETRLTKKVDGDGMYHLHGRFHPELGHAIFSMIDAETSAIIKAGVDGEIDRPHLAAHALGNLVTGGHQAIRPREAEILLVADAATAIDGPHEHSVCEYGDGTPVPPSTLQRLVCNGRITPIIVDSNGVVLNAGRTQRLANRAQRRALRAMYRTCAFHGCDVPFNDCEIHHIRPFETDGLTDLDDLIPACPRHHHLVHDQNWTLELDERRTLTIRDAAGETFAVVPLRRPGRSTTDRSSSEATPSQVRSTPPASPPPAGSAPPGTDRPLRPPGRPPDQLTLIA